MVRSFSSILLSALVSSVFAFGAHAQELDPRAKFGSWSVVCDKSAATKVQCSVVAAAHGYNDAHMWSKVGLFLTGNELEMILRTPRLTNVRDGVSLGFDGTQYGRAFLDKCDLTSCEATVVIGPELRTLIGTRKKMTVQYPISENEGAALAFDLDGIVDALSYLSNQPGMRSEAIASVEDFRKSTTTGASPGALARYVKIERRQLPKLVSAKQTEKNWSQPLNECGKTPAIKEIRVDAKNDIVDSEELQRWLAASKKCSEEVLVWVVPKTSTETVSSPSGLDRNILALYRVYGSVKEQMPQVVISMDDKNRIPLQGSARPELAISTSIR
ncbi:invasion associated locus B family protein [Bradyrhizobium symbiodeficiens]|uniref:invasion associated locus B family protein n=1 Tax=Bradyrhizobium symbiodeficiens TaxID=1404367 RepID=UPI00140FB478|nr:invasion associated locus B family protein [Bradyrhizobium symbiodeficiens]QIO98728.1 hypothetical protein HAU86_02370 [Bradyrhizobium symbiodeficiens]